MSRPLPSVPDVATDGSAGTSIRFIKFESVRNDRAIEYGISWEWLTALFVGDASPASAPAFLPAMPPAARRFAQREALASFVTPALLSERGFSCRDPGDPELECKPWATFTADRQGGLPAALLPIFYGFTSASGEAFWICVYALHGRITQVYFPARKLVVFEISLGNAKAVIASLEAVLAGHSNDIGAKAHAGKPCLAGRVGLLDMVNNLGHQLINHLPGVQQLLDLGLLSKLDEVWTSGTFFFGELEMLYPELAGRVRYFENRWDMAAESLRHRATLTRIGSTYLSAGLKQRLLARIPVTGDRRESPLLVVTVRAEGRVCLNLAEVVAELFRRLAAVHNLKIALDGWVIPESRGAPASHHTGAIRSEMELAREIIDRLPDGAVAVNTIGRPVFESLAELRTARAYFCHVGTLQHKLGMLLDLPGVVHGPIAQLAAPEGGPFLSESGASPIFMATDAIQDVPTGSVRGPSFNDYRIKDLSSAVDSLTRMLTRNKGHSEE